MVSQRILAKHQQNKSQAKNAIQLNHDNKEELDVIIGLTHKSPSNHLDSKLWTNEELDALPEYSTFHEQQASSIEVELKPQI